MLLDNPVYAAIAIDLPTTFLDVSESDKYYKEVQSLKDAGILSGDGDGNFRPNDAITGYELAAMLVKAKGLVADWMSLVNNSSGIGWIDELLQEYGGEPVPGNVAELAIYKLTGLDIFTTKFPYYTTETLRINVAHLLAKAQKYAELDIKIKYEPGFEFAAQVARRNMIYSLPLEILERFEQEGWSIYVGDDRIQEYMNTQKKSNISGLCSYREKTLYISTQESIFHEFGHFADRFLWLDDNRISELFNSEKESSKELISKYSASSQAEFIAETFSYYLNWKDSEKRMAEFTKKMPLTYEYMENLEMNNWTN